MRKYFSLNSPFEKTAILVSSCVWLGTTAYLTLAYSHLPSLIPLWHSRLWGTIQLASKEQVILVSLGFLLILVANTIIISLLAQKRAILGTKIIAAIVLPFQLIYALEIWVLAQRVLVSSVIPTNYLTQAILPASLGAIITLALTPLVIKLANKYHLVTDPQKDRHPAMLLVKPTPRSGAVGVVIAIITASLVFLPLTKNLIGIYLGAIVATITGLLDDKFDLNPYVRLGILMPLAALLVVGLGVGIPYLTNPFGGVISLTSWQISFNWWGPHTILVLADIVSFVWILWVMNMLSWSNGVDGQFPGVVAIAALTIGILSFRLEAANPEQAQAAILSFATLGALLGVIKYTWHPCRILLGFGATAIGLIVAATAVLSISKVAAATMVLLVPSFDALYAILRRLKRGQSPVWGDREHLHHKLLDLGLNQPQTAIAYWVLTALFGGAVLLTSGQAKIITVITGLGILATILVIWTQKAATIQKGQGRLEEVNPREAALSSEKISGP